MYKEIQRDRVQSHIWLFTASSYMMKYLRILSYFMKPFLIYDFAPDPIRISLYMSKILFSFLSVHTPPPPLTVYVYTVYVLIHTGKGERANQREG